MQTEHPWYHVEGAKDVDTPALLLYPERVQQNIAAAIRYVTDPARLRPHAKTHKTIEATQLCIAAGITKFKCATIAEAEMLAIAGAGDVLLAYEPQGPKIRRLLALQQQYLKTKFSCLIDDPQAANTLSAEAAAAHQVIHVFMDLNAGMNRTGIAPGPDAVRLYQHLCQMPGIAIAGLHIYDGHLHQREYSTRKQASDLAFEQVTLLKKQLQKEGYKVQTVIAGGSPTFPIHAERKDVECSPGTFIYWDQGYLEVCPEQPFIPAALVMTRVISLPASDLITTDLGHKSIASENILQKRVHFINAPELEPVSHSEEHLVLRAMRPHNFKPGDLLFGIPYHVCPTCALYEEGITVEQHKITGSWKTIARNRKITI